MRTPKVTVGLPVYNGAGKLEGALESLLAQDLRDFELVVSDNASTDDTPRICEQVAARDARVRVVRQRENVGASRNFAAVLAEARTEYFVWAAHDDRFAPSYLRRTLAAIEAHPSAVLAVSRVRFLDLEGRPHPREPEYENLHTLGCQRVERVRRLFEHFHCAVAFYGLGRASDLRRLGVEKPAIGQDLVALAQLLVQGDVVRVDEPLFEYRVGPSKRAKDYERQLGSGVDLTRPYTKLFVDMLRPVFESDWSEAEKETTLVAAVVTLARQNRSWRRLIAKEHFGRLHRWSPRLFAALLCSNATRNLRAGNSWRDRATLQCRVQSAFGRSVGLHSAEA